MMYHHRRPFGLSATFIAWAVILIGLVAVGLPLHGFAQTNAPDPNDQFAIQVWVTENGLPQNVVTALLQNREGYIWASTYNGVAQFDGENFRVFDSGHTAGLTNSRVTSLYLDRTGDIWIGHDTSDLTRYSQGKFANVPIHASWSGGTICGIAADASGDVWILDIRGEAVRVRDGLLVKPLPEMAQVPSVMPELMEDGEHRLLSVRNGYVAEITPHGFVKLDFHSDEARPYYSRVATARKGGLWVLGTGRVRRWDKDAWQDDLGDFPWKNAFVMTMMETSSGQLLVGTLERGLFIHDPALGWMNLNRDNGLPQDWIRCLTEDHERNIWVGTSGGLIVLRPRSVVMRNPPDGWGGRPVQAIAEAQDGAIWAATEGAGLYRMETNTWEKFGINEGLSNLFVWSVIQDHQGRIWAGTWGGGLFRYEGDHFERKFDFLERGEAVTAMVESKPGTIWIGTTMGLARYQNEQIDRFASLGDTAAADVRALAYGLHGEIWFGSQGQGLGRLNDGVLKTFHKADGLPSEFILSLHQASDGRLWIGTLDRGVWFYEAGHFYGVTMDQGLPNNSIGHIEEDGLGHLWCSSQQGLFRADLGDLIECAEGRRPNVSVLVFGKAEGLATLAGSSGFTPSGFRAKDGRLWFPTERGLAAVNPKAVRRNSVPPAVWIEEMLVDGQPMDIRTVKEITDGTVIENKVVTLQPGRRQLEVLFTGLSFTSPDQVQFKYRLSGLDNDWTWGGNQRRVTYPFLPPGRYTFRVIARNGDGLWNEMGDAVGVIVLPYFYQTWWFTMVSLIAGLALVGGGAYLESRRRHRRKLDRIGRDRELERERARIAQDIHDDLGASLTRIGMLSESATEDLDDRVRAAASLGQIYSTARDLTRAMDEIVWAVNPRHDTLESLTNYITRFAHDFLSAAHIRCRLDAPMQVPGLVVRSEVRHNLFLAFKEALNNTVKHSGATEVRVTLEFNSQNLTLMVADNGSGFDPGETSVPKGDRLVSGYGINSIRTRLEQVGGRMEMQTKKGEGTRVVLVVSMRGTASTQNGNGIGARKAQ